MRSALTRAIAGAWARMAWKPDAQVLADQVHDQCRFIVAEAQPAADLLRHRRARLVVAVEADALRPAEGRRLAHIVQQHGQREDWRGIL